MFVRERPVDSLLTGYSRTDDGLDSFAQLLDRLSIALDEGKPILDRLELARPPFLRALQARVLPPNEASFPLARDDLRCLQQASEMLARLRDLYLDCRPRPQDAVAGLRLATDETADAVEQVMPTVRALDAQSRLLRIGLRNRISIVAGQWNELARIALKARASTFMDEPVPDPVSMLKGNTARALFVMPLLLRVAHLEAYGADDRLFIERLARQFAHRVGFRIDKDGALRPNGHGPTIVVDEQFAVRLDTHHLQAEIARQTARLAKGVEYRVTLPRGLSVEAIRRLLATLALVWGPAMVPTRLKRVDPTGCAVLFGLPSPPAQVAQAAQESSLRYEYGTDELNTVVRLARKRHQQRAAPLAWLAYAESVVCNSWTNAQGIVQARLERYEFAPLNHHSLVLLRPDSAKCPAAMALEDAEALWVGRLMSMSQQVDLQSARYARQHLTVQVWPAAGRIVGLRFSADSEFESVLYLRGAAGSLDEHSVFLQPGSWSSKSVSTLRLADHDVAVRFGNLIEHGFRFERVRLLIGADHENSVRNFG